MTEPTIPHCQPMKTRSFSGRVYSHHLLLSSLMKKSQRHRQPKSGKSVVRISSVREIAGRVVGMVVQASHSGKVWPSILGILWIPFVQLISYTSTQITPLHEYELVAHRPHKSVTEQLKSGPTPPEDSKTDKAPTNSDDFFFVHQVSDEGNCKRAAV